ncbi:MAG: DUF547 domain-containing protein [Sphingobacteriales bacterium]|nr:DUF547 domain-containing protein [Sphingobacteriales bacterium]
MKLNLLIITATLIFSINTTGQPSGGSKPGSPSHRVFDGLLQKYVSTSGKVNYKGLKKDKAVLESYISELAKQIPDNTWTKNASLTYWINAYNAFTLKLIVDNYPIKSITNLHGGKPWDIKWVELAGKKYSLNNIENDIIRPTFKDARIHFAVNCAAVSCPPLANTAYTEANINSLLDTRVKNFVNSAANEITAGKITISKIFDWYKADFGDAVNFINKYSNTKVNANATIEYKEYNWNLNEQ